MRLRPKYPKNQEGLSFKTLEQVWRARKDNRAWLEYFEQRKLAADKDPSFEPKVVAHIAELGGTMICRQLSTPMIVGPGFQGYLPEKRYLPVTIFAFLWSIICSMLVVVYGLKFDLNGYSVPSYMASWSPGSVWLFLNFISFVLSVLVIQPISLAFSALIQVLGLTGSRLVCQKCLDRSFCFVTFCTPHHMNFGLFCCSRLRVGCCAYKKQSKINRVAPAKPGFVPRGMSFKSLTLVTIYLLLALLLYNLTFNRLALT